MRLTEIPEGFRTLLPKEVRERQELLKRLTKVVEMWGYEPLLPPTIEFLEVFKAVDERLEELSFKLVDRKTGRLMAVRPDFTPQVSRIVASSFKDEEPPFRFYYWGKIFRDAGNEREIGQLGIELLGVEEVEADAEVIGVIANGLSELGIKSFQIDIGHGLFLEGALRELEIEGEEKKELVEILRHKDFSGIDLFSERLGLKGERREKLFKLLELYGREEVLKEAAELFKNPLSQKALSELSSVYKILKSYGFEEKVIFDLSEKRGMEYHTGITYEVFHPLLSSPLGIGGRYDQLLKKFGRELPATGIALSLDAITELLEKKRVSLSKERKDFYIIDLKKELHVAYHLAKELRKLGYTVARDILKRDYEKSVEVAFNKGYRFVVVLNRDEEPENLLFTSPEGFFNIGREPLKGLLEIVEKFD
ncbi:ATP phosphoribosyltransferase regulatory subunit [Thermovibrio sp.]